MLLFLKMRFSFCLLLMLSWSCSEKSSTISKSENLITDSLITSVQEEPFDLKVKKYEDPIRQSWRDPEFIMHQLGPLAGKVVADLGAGTGYFTFKMASSAKKVIAIDIEQQFLDYIEERKLELVNRNIANKIITRLTKANNPGLAPDEADVVLIVNTISYIKHLTSYLTRLRTGLHKDAKVIIVDYKIGEMPVGPPQEKRVEVANLIKSLKSSSFSITKIDTVSLQYQYVIVSKK